MGVGDFTTYPPEAAKLPKVGGLRDPDLEAIIALRPDLVIIRGKSEQVERLCRTSGIAVVEDKTDSFDSIFETVHELGDLVGEPDKATELIADMRGRLASIRSAADGQPRPRMLFTLRSPDRLANITTVADGSYLAKVIELAGGQNVFGELDVAYPQVALEEIIARRPDVVIEAFPGLDLDAATRRRLLDQWRAAGFKQLADEGRIHFLADDYVLIPSPRVVLLAENLHNIFSGGSGTSGH